jgi:L-seryl-tRNA(Ser) seleniumtransferase
VTTRTRAIPSIEQLRQRPGIAAFESRYGRQAVVEALRGAASAMRDSILRGESVDDDVAAAIEQQAGARLARDSRFSLRPVINATGVIVHTNLGRAPLSRAAAERVAEIAAGYSNLEYDVEEGSRDRRDVHARLICRLTGAEAACVVNNNAAATLISLAALAAGREVLVSRGELVEIGGGFRVPDVMAQSGAVLREVGTTNRTRAADYAAAITDRTALILRVHPSNFRVEGFTERPTIADLSGIARRFDLPLIEDAGSGWLVVGDEDSLALREEPAIAASLAAGVDLIMFSGDKLLGGPQAGIIAGRHDLVDRIRRHPLMRALRVDKMTYAALEATLQSYATDRALDVPVMRMIGATIEDLQARATALAVQLNAGSLRATVVEGVSTIGGGSAAGSELPTRLVQLQHRSMSATSLERRLRSLDPPVIARIHEDRVLLDLRTVLRHHDGLLATLLQHVSRMSE